ncbi:MAG TPA: protein kinase, partial [Spirochaetia bacterium]|nr:protein kinase [Spirochaetia bacterium]
MARIPEAIDKYKLEELIATGGMGRVYRGVHPTLERPVIIKKLSLRGDAAYAQRFRREASILMDFRSDYIVDVYDHFRKASNHYIVMEYVDGLSAQDLLRRERYLD